LSSYDIDIMLIYDWIFYFGDEERLKLRAIKDFMLKLCKAFVELARLFDPIPDIDVTNQTYLLTIHEISELTIKIRTLFLIFSMLYDGFDLNKSYVHWNHLVLQFFGSKSKYLFGLIYDLDFATANFVPSVPEHEALYTLFKDSSLI
jgi:hypothetical protein